MRHLRLGRLGVSFAASWLPLMMGVACNGPSVPVFSTPELAVPRDGVSIVTGLKLETRYSDDGKRLLIRAPSGDAVYAFDSVTNSVALTDIQAWENATGDVADGRCGFRMGREHPSLAFEVIEDELHIGGTRLSTTGDLLLAISVSPSERFVATLSASPRLEWPSIIPFMGRPGRLGARYHEVFSLPDLRRIGPRRRVAFDEEVGDMKVCWSAGEQFVLHAPWLGGRLAVVPFRGE